MLETCNTQEFIWTVELHQLFHGFFTDVIDPLRDHLLVPLGGGEDLFDGLLHASLNFFTGEANILKDVGGCALTSSLP